MDVEGSSCCDSSTAVSESPKTGDLLDFGLTLNVMTVEWADSLSHHKSCTETPLP